MPELQPLYTADEMRAAEERYPGFPDTAAELMNRAGTQAAQVALQTYHGAARWSVVAGRGSNGGDGRIMAARLEAAGKTVRVVDATSDASELGDADVLVDALFGTGFTGTPRVEAARLIERMNAHPAPVFAIDLPSGVDASTGEIPGAAVEADATVTFHGLKVGLVVAPGRFHAGRVTVADIGLEQQNTAVRLATRGLLSSIPRRSEGQNKYTAGHVLVVGGSRGLTGAPQLTALAAMRADAGYVTVAAPESSIPAVEHRLLEAVKRGLPEQLGIVSADAADVVLELAGKASAVALGPGLGRGDGPAELVRRVLAELELPVVVDADALFGLEPGEWPAPRVLTPHEGELGRLLGRESTEIAAHRLASGREAARRFRCCVLLKGPDTIVAAPGAGEIVAAPGPPSLATAGTGDVLTGIVAAFLAKGVEPQRAAAAAAVLQQHAAREAPNRAGLVAGDLPDLLPRVLG
jgi:ADP-dependent NAD(P)H-hydrate dehydratase / NAD(P)H-hydrate epimerase